MLDWMSSSARLMRDGAPRMAGLLDRLAGDQGPDADDAEEKTAVRQALLRARAVQLAVAMLFVVLLMLAGHNIESEPLRLGLNLWTAELAFVLAAGTSLVNRLRRLNA